jgi:hypothetical protein
MIKARENERCIQTVGNSERKRLHGKHRNRSEDNIKMDVKERWC